MDPSLGMASQFPNCTLLVELVQGICVDILQRLAYKQILCHNPRDTKMFRYKNPILQILKVQILYVDYHRIWWIWANNITLHTSHWAHAPAFSNLHWHAGISSMAALKSKIHVNMLWKII